MQSETGYLTLTVFSQCRRYTAFQVDLLNKVEIVLPIAAYLSGSNKLNLLLCGDLLIDNKKGPPKFYLPHREIFFLDIFLYFFA